MNHPLYEPLVAADQDHVLRFYPELEKTERERLDRQLHGLDLGLIARLTYEEHEAPDWADLAGRSTPPRAFQLADQQAAQAADQQAASISPATARQAGEEALRRGQVAAILVAGGQGSRLGFEHPKGMFPIGPVSGHSLFQILIEKIVATARRYAAPVPLYVMTSPATHEETVDYLAANDRFGLPKDDLIIFCQGTMPAVDAQTGRLILAAKDSLALAPDGHGGMLAALQASGALQQARDRNIEWFSYGQIDNPLVQICHPALIGYHVLANSDMTTQVIRKQHPLEKVGNVVMVDGKMQIIEYSDLPDDLAQRRNPDGSLVIWAGSIAVHVFRLAFLEQISHQADALPFHRASKKVPFVDEHGVEQTPDQPNAIKFERFIFDLLPWARNAVVVEGRAEEVFAPVKNAEGAETDTPTATRLAMTRLFTRWLRSAGATVKPDTPVEISPLWALDEAEVIERLQLPCSIDQPTFLTR
ncbi:MAG: UTP--glucose-1-phosphate uridylyltransferase [Pirellulaceae bacterium]